MRVLLRSSPISQATGFRNLGSLKTITPVHLACFFFPPGSGEEEKSTQWHESWCAHHLTYCWISQLSTHNPGINAGERVVTDCAPLVIVADLQPSFIWINSTHKTNSTIGTRNCSIYWNCDNNCKNIILLSQTTWPFLQCDQNVAIKFWLYYL